MKLLINFYKKEVMDDVEILTRLQNSLSLIVEIFESRGDESYGIGWSDVAARN